VRPQKRRSKQEMGKSTASIVVALVVGAAIGFALGHAGSAGSGSAGTAAVADAAKPADGNNKPAAPARPAAAGNAQIMKATFEGNQPSKGSADAKVTMIVVSDFQCPFCGRVEPTLKQIADTYGKDVRFVWGNNPLPFHPNAMPAALAAMAAHEQGKFWEFHDKLFANQRALAPEFYEQTAKELGLDMAKWKAAVDSQKYKPQIEAEQKRYSALGARGTPAFFINGRPFSGAQPFENFKAAIDAELSRANAELAKGTKPADLYAQLIKDGASTPPAAANDDDDAPKGPVYVEIPADAPIRGSKDAKITIVEFSDFQCPFCSRVTPTIAKIEEAYGKDVRVVWRNLPLPFHQNAQLAAEAAMAANDQGKFWQMHDKLFGNQQALQRPDLEKYAQEIGLDMKKFKEALDTGKFTQRVKDDAQYGSKVGARGTPSFFINGKSFSGAQPFDNFKQVIDAEIARADAAIKGGTPKDRLYEKLAGKS
jgi:protein-disulfide isomerase